MNGMSIIRTKRTLLWRDLYMRRAKDLAIITGAKDYDELEEKSNWGMSFNNLTKEVHLMPSSELRENKNMRKLKCKDSELLDVLKRAAANHLGIDPENLGIGFADKPQESEGEEDEHDEKIIH